MKKVALLLFSSTFWLLNMQAQTRDYQPYFSISYFGLLGTHPGLRIGVAYPVFQVNKQDLALKRDEVLVGAYLLFYYHRRNQLGLGGDFQFSFRSQRAKGMHKEIAFGLGYLRTFLPNRVYSFDQPHPPEKSTGQFLKMLSLGLGKSFDPKIGSNFWMIKPTLMHLKPFNTGTTLNFALDAGVYFQ